ncbi:MAG: lipopolysaccharide transport periplasmic protein LptA [Paracoccaceae bacterium]|nr:lipopolysaccharide transport periplasmic protein LptA [Paracoccaceae bacterium]
MLRVIISCLAIGIGASAAFGQAASIALGTGAFDASLPVEVTADQLSVDQNSGEATFDGNVLVVQGEVRMSAGRVTIEYAQDENSANGVSRLLATGGVTFVTASDAAEARDAVYSVADGIVTLSGDVLLTQGQSAIAGDKLVVNLSSGNGRMEGRVRTVFTPSGDGN